VRRKVRKTLFRAVEIFDYRTFAVAAFFLIVLLIGYLIFGAVQSAHDAQTSANQRGKAASKRIDGLQQTIADQAQTISDMRSRQARSDAAQEALARQVQQLGGQPVVRPQPQPTVYVVRSPSPEPSLRPFPSASPSPSRTPRPSPSPTCQPLPVIGCRHARQP
jgi:hypothetical protein